MNFYIDNYRYLLLLLVPALAGLLLLRFIRWRKAKQDAFAEPRFREAIFGKAGRFRKLFPMLYLAALLFLIFSIIDFLAGSEEAIAKQKVNNLVFALDLSNSMNAEDVEPSRLAQARNIITNSLDKFQNDRVGIVVFAGQAASVMPLTTDFAAAENYISAMETSVLKVQGTDFLQAVKTAAEKFKKIPPGARQVILISDGEDNEGNDAEAAKLAKKEGIKIIAVGIGTEEGAPVPEYLYGQLMGYKTDMNGNTVISRRAVSALKEMAAATGGEYIDGNDMEQAVQKLAAEVAKQSSDSSIMVKSQNPVHYYQYFLGVSLLLFFVLYLTNPKRDLNF
ncbi:Ca-activated chloride channel family protein [Cruoricaptor ignavus]|uniref:Ca-activated chloride channel family protein n=1 Tax=Cruoricaptor ignavus TaxID=1118202 RepID=A0A1M6EZE6_9FLAO|nr:VWA domain-containing protein [Cruoricaptor ignavus]QOR73687.1 VWA domain-containing protein [Cruoricaptor ignavus]SHI90759.1 Ca-activated chloride channel family protein [Cruoricaptor ignavus]